VRIIVAATPAVAIPTLDALRNSSHDLVSVITRPDAPAGRGRTLRRTEVADWADANGVLVHKPIDKESLRELVSGVDLVVTIGYGALIPLDILQIPKFGFINLHFSLLPRWRGAAPVQRTIEAGDKVTGVTVFQLDAGMDTGPIFQKVEMEMPKDVSSDQLFDILAEFGVDPVLKTLDQISSGDLPVPQSEDGASRALKLTKEEGRIDWSSSALDISRKVSAFNSNPGAWSQFRGETIKVNRVLLSDKSLAAGSLQIIDKSVFVGTATTALQILEVTPAGKAKMDAISWSNGARISSSDELV
jgi:methionyl-tRNA formyltransferase